MRRGPAYERYTGRTLYSADVKATISINPNQVFIVSALFGLIRPSDLIPYYDLKMDKKKGDMKVPTYLFWRNLAVLPDMINTNDVDLLSENYKKALNSNGIITAVSPKGFRYSDRGDCVGYWLENELNCI